MTERSPGSRESGVRVQVQRLRPGARLPQRATKAAAGFDLAACLENPERLEPGARVAIPTGIAVAIPEGFEGQVRPRSGLALDHGVTVLNSPGTVDSDYRGEIRVILVNLGERPYTIMPGDRIAQLIVSRACAATMEFVTCLPETPRGNGGFGHTGR